MGPSASPIQSSNSGTLHKETGTGTGFKHNTFTSHIRMRGLKPKYKLRNLIRTENELEENFGNTEMDEY
jgi:hypothetical protein